MSNRSPAAITRQRRAILAGGGGLPPTASLPPREIYSILAMRPELVRQLGHGRDRAVETGGIQERDLSDGQAHRPGGLATEPGHAGCEDYRAGQDPVHLARSHCRWPRRHRPVPPVVYIAFPGVKAGATDTLPPAPVNWRHICTSPMGRVLFG